MSSFAGISSTTVSTTQLYPLGLTLVEANGDKGLQTWIYVYNDEASTAFAQGTVCIRDLGTETYDAIVSTGAVNHQRVIGVAQHEIAAGSYGFILRDGIGEVLCDGNVSADTAITCDATAGQATDVGTAATSTGFGLALEADSGAGTLVTARLFCVG